MHSFYDPNNIAKIKTEDDYDFVGSEEFVIKKTDNLFHINQPSESKPVNTLYCKHCGGNNFNVGSGSYFTAIKCVKCNWEVCIHEG